MTAPKNSGATQNKTLSARRNPTKSYSNNKSSIKSSVKESSRQALKLARQRRGAAALVLPNKSKRVVRRYIPSKRHHASKAGLPAPRSSAASHASVSAATCEHKQTTLSNTVLHHEGKPVVMLLRTCDARGHIVQNLATEITSAKSPTSTSENSETTQPQNVQQINEPVEQALQTTSNSLIDPKNQAAEEWASMHHPSYNLVLLRFELEYSNSAKFSQ